jgi:hypothetical protein
VAVAVVVTETETAIEAEIDFLLLPLLFSSFPELLQLPLVP